MTLWVFRFQVNILKWLSVFLLYQCNAAGCDGKLARAIGKELHYMPFVKSPRAWPMYKSTYCTRAVV